MVADHLSFLNGELAEMVQQERHKGAAMVFVSPRGCKVSGTCWKSSAMQFDQIFSGIETFCYGIFWGGGGGHAQTFCCMFSYFDFRIKVGWSRMILFRCDCFESTKNFQAFKLIENKFQAWVCHLLTPRQLCIGFTYWANSGKGYWIIVPVCFQKDEVKLYGHHEDLVMVCLWNLTRIVFIKIFLLFLN